MSQLCLWTKIRTKTVTRFGCDGFSMYACGFSVRHFCLFTYPPRSKWAEKMIIFFAKIGIFCKSIAGPLSEAYTQRFRCFGFSMYACGFPAPQMRKFCLFTTRQEQNELHLKRWFFFLTKSKKSIFRSQRCSSVYTTIFIRWKDKTNDLSNQLWMLPFSI